MTNQDSDGLFENDWDDRSELSWSEADWETYLAQQDRAIRDYQRAYDSLPPSPSRIDQVARQLGWESADAAAAEDAADEDEDEEPVGEAWDLYTLHRNPVYIATRAIYTSLIERWQELAAGGAITPVRTAVSGLGVLDRGQEAVFHGIHSLEMGDYTLAVCFFKRALQELNAAMALVAAGPARDHFGEFARPRFFDLREILLRVMNECRQEERQQDDAD